MILGQAVINKLRDYFNGKSRFNAHRYISGIVGTTELSVGVSVQHLVFITNDGDNTILINFNKDTTSTDTIKLLKGETISNFEFQIERIYLKTENGSSSFRLLGVR